MLEIFSFQENQNDDWDAFCRNCIQSTFLHTRRFLSYHGKRFRDRSLVLKKKNKIIALFPAAEHPSNNGSIVSHPGITYGGLLHTGALVGEEVLEAFHLIKESYSNHGFEALIYKAVPCIYHQSPCNDDLYALFRFKAIQKEVDLSCAINLFNRQPLSTRRKRCLEKAKKSGAYVKQGNEHLCALWDVLQENLFIKHGIRPTHNLSEILRLTTLFPQHIECTCALIDKKVIAGVITFSSNTCLHAQYIASNITGYNLSALDLIFNALIEKAKLKNQQWFDFGISTENNGDILNSTLHKFKTEFGGGGITYDHFLLKLK